MTRVLIVEDHAHIRTLIRMTLEFEGFDIHEASDGTSGLHKAAEINPDVMLLDIMMPGELDGLQVLDAIKSDPALKDTLVAMITARGQAADFEVGKQRGANAYFIKPFSPLQVINWIRESLK